MKSFLMIVCLFLVNVTAFASEEVIVGPSYEGSQVERDYSEGVLKELPVCLQWETKKQCQNRRICRMVCTVGGTIMGGAAGNIGGQVCNEVCEMIPECSNIRVCVRYSTSPAR